MKLWELLEDVSAADIRKIEKTLDTHYYQPEDKLKRNQPVLDLELPTGNSHFMQRIQQRSGKADISPMEIARLLAKAKTDPAYRVNGKLDALSSENNPSTDVIAHDPDTKLTIPLIVKPNEICTKTQDGNPVCGSPQGKAPRNKAVAKTIYRKGIDD